MSETDGSEDAVEFKRVDSNLEDLVDKGPIELSPKIRQIIFVLLSIVYCISSCDGGIIPTKSMVRNSVLLPYHMYMRFVDGILGIIFNQETGKDAIEKCKS